MRKVLGSSFFDRKAVAVAPDLLGKFLVRRIGKRVEAHMIVETEAYEGGKDLACHASKGRTKRTEVMFGDPGHWYIYFVYGMHEMLNVVTGPGKRPSAVLIRGIEKFRKPGVLTRELRVDRALNGAPTACRSGLWIEDRGVKILRSRIQRIPRIGVAYAKEWAKKPWRFVLAKKLK